MTDDTPRELRKKESAVLWLLSTQHIDMSLNNDSASGYLMKCLQCDLVLNSSGITECQVFAIAPVYQTATRAKALLCIITSNVRMDAEDEAGESSELRVKRRNASPSTAMILIIAKQQAFDVYLLKTE